jgi:tetratricopeptide (TPR) repeat protein
LGVLYYAFGQYKESLGMLARAIKLDPTMADAWYNVGALYDMCDQPEDAQQAYMKARENGLADRFARAGMGLNPVAMQSLHHMPVTNMGGSSGGGVVVDIQHSSSSVASPSSAAAVIQQQQQQQQQQQALQQQSQQHISQTQQMHQYVDHYGMAQLEHHYELAQPIPYDMEGNLNQPKSGDIGMLNEEIVYNLGTYDGWGDDKK